MDGRWEPAGAIPIWQAAIVLQCKFYKATQSNTSAQSTHDDTFRFLTFVRRESTLDLATLFAGEYDSASS